MAGSSNAGLPRLEAIHRRRLEQLKDMADQMSGSARQISTAIEQVLENGGMIHIQPQINHLISLFARVLKDWGVAEQLQAENTSQRKRSRS